MLSDHAPILKDPTAPLLPRLKDAYLISQSIAMAVAKQAVIDGVAAKFSDEEIAANIKAKLWSPEYLTVKLINSGLI